MQHDPTHRLYCDRRHLEVGSPVCSAMVGQVETVSVMLYANGDRTDVALVVDDGTQLLAWDGTIMLRLVRVLEEAVAIATNTWPPLVLEATQPALPTLLDETVEQVVISPPTDEYTENYGDNWGGRPPRRIVDDDDNGADQ